LYNLAYDIGEKHQVNDQERTNELLKKKNEWASQMIDPVFLGLRQNKEYNKLHPDRFDLEKY